MSGFHGCEGTKEGVRSENTGCYAVGWNTNPNKCSILFEKTSVLDIVPGCFLEATVWYKRTGKQQCLRIKTI